MRYRRSHALGATFFFTVVTYHRKRILCLEDNPVLLRQSFAKVKARHAFTIDAIVLLPDHLHCIWTLPPGDNDFSKRWMLIKSDFTGRCKDPFAVRQRDPSSLMKRECTIWQRRLWEHQIRDDSDFERHVEYIHYNPVKHGLAKSPLEWKYSSFHKYVERGFYSEGWGIDEEATVDETLGHE